MFLFRLDIPKGKSCRISLFGPAEARWHEYCSFFPSDLRLALPGSKEN